MDHPPRPRRVESRGWARPARTVPPLPGRAIVTVERSTQCANNSTRSTDHVACRLRFGCTPQRQFLGIEAGGRRVSFGEHVFYRFRDSRIEQVWSAHRTVQRVT
ncbi:ester cyclase [Jidongwangia harbinensis]|uniref:ester cyclase n=1 Tax=Jidongwangia harbinensis TaxID=2878561 RepID=UPI001CD9A0B8|nr:ester cyclase [Jidongwangia harbinensis]MCA2211900.1 ester cyclase [Jidongwangia harbinensis]